MFSFTNSKQSLSIAIRRTSLEVTSGAVLFSSTDIFALESEASTSTWVMPWMLLALAAIFVVQAIVVWVLLAQNRRQRQADTEVKQQRAEITHAARLALVGELTASITHEVSQPLGVILSNAEAAELLLKQNPMPLEEVRQILKDIRRDDLRAYDIVKHLRSLLQKRALQFEMIDINEVISHVQQLVEPDARRRKIAIKNTFAAQLPKIKADPVYLQQVLLNLIVNAMDAIDNAANHARILEVQTTRSDSKSVTVTVVDSGPGFAPSRLARLFDPFVTTKPNGMGLGLSIARSIVHAHRGTIWAENGASGGGVVGFAIPTHET